MIPSYFLRLCPNCGGDISSERLYAGLPCEKCMPEIRQDVCSYEDLKGFMEKICKMEEELSEWEAFFQKRIGSKPWSLQLAWAKRVLLGRSFALLAPTGVGKTSFGTSMAVFLAKKGKRSYIIVPTKLLLKQIHNKLLSLGLEEEELLYFGDETEKEKEKKRQLLQEGRFKVLLTTSMFLYRNYQAIPRGFSFVFVDDVDSFLKTAKNIDKALYLLGFDEEDIQKALELIKEKSSHNRDYEKIKSLSEEVKKLSLKAKGVLVVSSATSNPRSNRVKLFRELLGFEVGTPTFYLRNVVDAYVHERPTIETLVNWIRKLGKGGLVFVSSDMGKEQVEKLKEALSHHGINSLTYEELTEENLKLYEEGKVEVLIGIASYRNPLARGFDMPHVVRYAIFYGVPKMSISLKLEENLSHLLWALTSIRSLIVKQLPHYGPTLERWIERLRRYQYLSEEFLEEKQDLKEKVDNLKLEISKFLNSEDVIAILESSNEVTLRRSEEGYYLVVSDVTGYLQASGRTSRMYAGGISKGLSLVLVDDVRALNHLQKRVRWFNEDIKLTPIEEIDIGKIVEEIDRDREKIKNILAGKEKPQSKDILKPILIVVESPNKARTIANFFGKPVRRRVGDHELLETSVEDRYIMITASLGHITDLNKERDFHGVYVSEDSIVPYYEVIEGKEGIVESLRLMAMECSEVLVATDPDTEGEKIGWDIRLILRPYVKNIKRMEFHEVTKKAILKGIKEPRDFNENLVKAQIVRRIADRWVGFEFSQELWRAFGKNWLSAGRVQTPVLGWIIKREQEYRQKIYKVIINLDQDDKRLRIEFTFDNKQEAKEFFDNLDSIRIEKIEEAEEYIHPPPPYRTDTLLKDASDKFKFSLQKTMDLAQTLFELGFITYHRTDSVRVSDYGIAIAREFIEENFGKEYFHPRVWGEGGAHECIRPTKNIEPEELRSLVLSGQVEGLNKDHLAIYTLVFKRFMASQMKPAKVRVIKTLIKALDKELTVSLRTHILEEGFNNILPIELNPSYEDVTLSTEGRKYLKASPRAYLYTYGELVMEMKEKGIGRPSTYATIVEKLIERGYVIEKKGFLIPTRLGKEIYQYLSSKDQIKGFVSEEFTKELEKMMDMVEDGKENYISILKKLYRDIIILEKELEVGR
ncbi:reverse gyrase [Thermocrinis minervae]|uniref:Reverse gyrase n=1 Tax=Thermocrinis minervae TaxID=381751 RepID=A0A1M6QGR2_9AQUI|nr:reverse gyrase [Thermocrinis minervae]SHK19422.1 Reverse gyrase [Thermocrinis minervae]